MKSKDQELLEEAYRKVAEGHQTLTPAQEETYSKLRAIGYEFDYWDGKDVVVTKRDRGEEYSSVVDSKAILPTGETFPMKHEDDVEYGDRIADEGF